MNNDELDKEAWKLRQGGLGPRPIARKLGKTAPWVQRSLARTQRRLDEESGELAALEQEIEELLDVEFGGDDLDPSPDAYRRELSAEIAADPANELAKYRLGHCPPPGFDYEDFGPEGWKKYPWSSPPSQAV